MDVPQFLFIIEPGFLDFPVMYPNVPGKEHLFCYSVADSCVPDFLYSARFMKVFQFSPEPSFPSEYRPAIAF
jgi:hypothetical protein